MYIYALVKTQKDKYEYSNINRTAYFDTEDGGSTFKKYFNNGGLTELQPEDDAATVKWGRSWQTPSLAQCMELYNSKYTTTTWTTLNGVKGRMVTSNSNSKCNAIRPSSFPCPKTCTIAGKFLILQCDKLDMQLAFVETQAAFLHLQAAFVKTQAAYQETGRANERISQREMPFSLCVEAFINR